jgi:hypothetical protein
MTDPDYDYPPGWDEEAWEEIELDLQEELAKKNTAVWKHLWEEVLASLYLSSIQTRTTVLPSNAHELARKYFEKRGLELVKSLTRTDIEALKADLLANWGMGKDAFIKAVQDSYPVSTARLESIFRSEYHIADLSGSMDYEASQGARTKTWVVSGLDNMCLACQEMDGETVPIDVPYSNGEMVAHLHPNCQCLQIINY